MNEHDARTTSMWIHPKIIGLENIVGSAKEFNLFKDNGDLFHQPDNVFFDYNNKIIYNVEYKLTNQRTKAIKQLQESATYLRRMFRTYNVVNLYVHKNYLIERIS